MSAQKAHRTAYRRVNRACARTRRAAGFAAVRQAMKATGSPNAKVRTDLNYLELSLCILDHNFQIKQINFLYVIFSFYFFNRH